MYTSFYNLNTKPFQISSDPAFMWFGEKHKEALATLRYGILDNKGFLLLTGDVGTGKTSLINSLIQKLGEDIVYASVPDPSLEKMEFLNYIALAFGMDKDFTTKGAFLFHFRRFLMEAYENNKKVLLIIDESQLLSHEMLEEIRLLSNIEKTNAKLINIFFVGQNEFNELLNQEQNRAVRQRLTLNYNLDPLTPDETGEYIKHRLKVAGTTQAIFDTSAVQEIFIYTGGFPRRINIICDHSLLSGFVKDQKQIDHLIVRECAKELKIPAYIRNRDVNDFYDHRSRPAPEPTPVIRFQPDRPKNPQNSQKKTKSTMVWGMAFLFVFVLSWFLIIPDHFKDALAGSTGRFVVLKNQIIPLVPDSFKHYFKPYPSDSNLPPDNLSAMRNKSGEENLNSQKPKTKKIISKLILADHIEPAKTVASGEVFSFQPTRESIIPKNNQKQTNTPSPLNSELETLLPNPSDHERANNRHGVEIKKPLPPLPKDKVIIRFKYNTNDFTESGLEDLKIFADLLANNHGEMVIVTGYTDSDGDNKYNRKLSEFRANIVKSFLLGKGIKPEQMKINGLGSQYPIESNNTAWGRMMNRRVEIEVLNIF